MQHLSVISAARVLAADVRENNLKSIFNREQNEGKARREIGKKLGEKLISPSFLNVKMLIDEFMSLLVLAHYFVRKHCCSRGGR